MPKQTSRKKTWTFRFDTLEQKKTIRAAAKRKGISANKWVVRVLGAAATAVVNSPDTTPAHEASENSGS